MIKKLIITLMLMANLAVCQQMQAQECDANFTYSINSENGLFVTLVPNDLESITVLYWYLDGIFLSTATELLYTFEESGSHLVCLQVVTASEDTCIRCMNICVDMATDMDTSTASIGGVDMQHPRFELFPNPPSDKLVLRFNLQEIKGKSEINFNIVDVEGKILNTIVYQAYHGDNELLIDVADLRAGTYFLNIQSDQFFESQKFIKK